MDADPWARSSRSSFRLAGRHTVHQAHFMFSCCCCTLSTFHSFWWHSYCHTFLTQVFQSPDLLMYSLHCYCVPFTDNGEYCVQDFLLWLDGIRSDRVVCIKTDRLYLTATTLLLSKHTTNNGVTTTKKRDEWECKYESIENQKPTPPTAPKKSDYNNKVEK